MNMIVPRLARSLTSGLAALLVSLLVACGSSQGLDKDGRVYHCVAMDHPIPPPNVRAPRTLLELFEYGDYRLEDRPTISGGGYCATLRVPGSAYIRYRSEGKVVEKRFDLSSLDAQRVYDKTVEFFVDGDIVEVRLVTRVKGDWPIKEVIVRQ